MGAAGIFPDHRLRRGIGLALAILAATAAGLAWLVGSESGLRAVLAVAGQASGGRLSAQRAQGSLLGGFSLEALSYRDATVALRAGTLRLDWDAAALAGARLRLSAAMATLEVAAASTGDAPRAPADLRLPLAVAIDRLTIGRLTWTRSGTPAVVIESLEARFASDGRRHRIESLRMVTAAGVLDGEAELDGAAPFPLRARAGLSGRRGADEYRVDLSAAGPLDRPLLRLEARGLGAGAAGEALLAPFAAAPLTRLALRLTGLDPARLLRGAPRAPLSVTVTLERPAAVVEHGLALAGTVAVRNAGPAPVDSGGLPVSALHGRVSWVGARLAVEDIDVELPGGGRLRGSAGFADGRGEVRLNLAAVDLARLFAAARPTRLAGRLVVTGDATAQTVSATLAEPRFSAALEARRQGELLELDRLHLGAGKATLTARGRVALAAGRAFELTGTLRAFDPARYVRLPPMTLNAELAASGRLDPAPAVALQLRLADSRVAGRPLAGGGSLRLAPDHLERIELALDVAGNRLRAEGAWGRPGERLAARLDAPDLAALGAGLAGRATARLELSGSPAAPAGSLSLAADALVLPGGQRLARLSGEATLREGADGPFRLELTAAELRPAGGAAPLIARLSLAAQGRRDAHRVDLAATLAGEARLTLVASGGFVEPFAWQGRIDGLQGEGGRLPTLVLLAPATLRLARHEAELGPAELRVNRARLRLLETRHAAGVTHLRGEADGLMVSALHPGGAALGGDLSLAADWQLALGEQANGRLRIRREDGDLTLRGERPMALVIERLELQAVVADNQLRLDGELRGGRLGAASVAASGRLERAGAAWRLAPEAPVAGSLRFRMPRLDWLAALAGPGFASDGAVEGEIGLSGNGAAPRLAGRVEASQLGLAAYDAGIRLAGGRLRAHFDDEALVLDELSFAAAAGPVPREVRLEATALRAAGGRLVATGRYRYGAGEGELVVRSERLALVQRVDRWLAVSGEGRLTMTGELWSLGGRLVTDAGYWRLPDADRPRLSDDVVVLGAAPAPRRGPRLALDVEVDLGAGVQLAGRGLDTRLTGAVRLSGDGRSPLRARGSVSTRGGSFDAYGRELAIERGIVTFQGALENPALNIVALRRNLAVEAGVEILGTAQRPRIRLVSEPDVPEAEKLSWIVLGHGQDESGGDLGVLVSAANAILGGSSSGGVSRQLAAGLGLDEIALGGGAPGAGASQLPRSTVAGGTRGGGEGLGQQFVTLGKRLSNTAYLSYEHSLAGALGVVKLTVSLGRRLSLVGRAGADNAVDLLYLFSFE